MEVVKAFNSNNLHTEIVIKGTYDKPLFRASDVGNVLEISTIRSVIRDFNETEKVVHSMHTLGGEQDVTFLTEKGLYKVLFKSRKPIAEKFQNWVCEIITEIRLNGKYELEKQLEQAKNEIVQIEESKKKELDEKVLREREKMLLREYGHIGSLFYIIKVKTNSDGTYIVKIGESRRGVQSRYDQHKTIHGEILLLDCFLVDKSLDFEQFILNHENIKFNKVTDLEKHEGEKELFLIGKNLTYKMLLHIVNTNIKSFNNNVEYFRVENETLKQVIASSNQTQQQYDNISIIQELLNNQKEMMKIIQNLEKSNREILEKICPTQIKVTTGFEQPLVTLGPRLQKINPENLNLVKVYESVAECIKESKFVMKRPTIDKAVKENTIYQGFRWMYVERDKDPNIIDNIIPTKVTKIQNIGYIAKLNNEKTEILNVYLDRKTASISNGYESSSALDNPVKNGTITKGNYYVLFDKCPSEIKDDFIEKHGEPLLYKDGIGQYDSIGHLINEFTSKYDCIKKIKISDKTLAKALDKNITYNNTYFKTLGSKLHL